jgi:cell envelope opacity-associated protein A
MRLIYAIAFLLPSVAWAQQPQPAASAAFAGQLATTLAEVFEQRDALQKQVALLEKQIAELKAAKVSQAETPSGAPKP